MTLLALIGILWGLGALVRASREAKRSAEAARLREEWKREREARSAQLQREIGRERELMRIAREQERQAKEQARQAEQLARHEEQLAKLEYRMSQAEADIAAESERIASLYALMDIAAAEQAAAVPGSKSDVKAQKQIISYQAAIRAAEKRKAKAEFTKQTAQQKLSA